jgi:hypothetical protein
MEIAQGVEYENNSKRLYKVHKFLYYLPILLNQRNQIGPNPIKLNMESVIKKSNYCLNIANRVEVVTGNTDGLFN